MAIHDMWHFENAPQGVNLCIAQYTTAYTPNTIYTQDTGNVGQPQWYNTNANTFTVSSDGFLMINSNSSGQQGGLLVPISAVQDLSVATQYWIGFRTKMTVANSSTAPLLFGITSNTSWSTYTTMLNENIMINAGLTAVGAEHYVEVFLDRIALTFQVYVDGILVNSGTTTAALYVGASFFWWGGISTGTASYARGYRDFYFLDVDATYTKRLGPIRAKAATLTAVTNTDWTVNGAADILTALNTAIGSGATTPNAQSAADKQPLTLSLSTTVTDAGNKILGVTPGLSFTAANGTPVSIAAGFKDGSNPLVAAGTFSQSNSGIPLYNQKLPLVLNGPNGQPWTAAEINQAQYVLTPQ